MKEAIAHDAERRSVLELLDFVRLCERSPEPGEAPGDPIESEPERRALLRTLHELGTVVAHGLKDHAMLPNVHILDPNWLTQGFTPSSNTTSCISSAANSAGTSSRIGFQRTDIHRFFRLHPQHDAGQGNRTVFPARNGGARRFLVPEALPVEGPDLSGLFPDECLRFSFHYDLLPRSLMPRFIVKTHAHGCTPPMRWRTGVLLKVEGCKVHVEADREKKRVLIKVAGPEKSRRAALSVVRNVLKSLHDINPLFNPQPFVPLPDNPKVEETMSIPSGTGKR